MSTDDRYQAGVADGVRLQQLAAQFERIEQAGQQAYPDWNTRAQTLGAVGADAQLVMDAADVSNLTSSSASSPATPSAPRTLRAWISASVSSS